jgi:hypothetical protein
MSYSEPVDLTPLKTLAEAVVWALNGHEWDFDPTADPKSIYTQWVKASGPDVALALIARCQAAEAALTLIADKMTEWESVTRKAGVWNPKDADAVMALWVGVTAARGLSGDPSALDAQPSPDDATLESAPTPTTSENHQ